jgi:hypothetical protein
MLILAFAPLYYGSVDNFYCHLQAQIVKLKYEYFKNEKIIKRNYSTGIGSGYFHRRRGLC